MRWCRGSKENTLCVGQERSLSDPNSSWGWSAFHCDLIRVRRVPESSALGVDIRHLAIGVKERVSNRSLRFRSSLPAVRPPPPVDPPWERVKGRGNGAARPPQRALNSQQPPFDSPENCPHRWCAAGSCWRRPRGRCHAYKSHGRQRWEVMLGSGLRGKGEVEWMKVYSLACIETTQSSLHSWRG